MVTPIKTPNDAFIGGWKIAREVNARPHGGKKAIQERVFSQDLEWSGLPFEKGFKTIKSKIYWNYRGSDGNFPDRISP